VIGVILRLGHCAVFSWFKLAAIDVDDSTFAQRAGEKEGRSFSTQLAVTINLSVNSASIALVSTLTVPVMWSRVENDNHRNLATIIRLK